MISFNKYKKLFFVGIAGSGMSALAQFASMKSIKVYGSDRSIDHETADNYLVEKFKELNIQICQQNGSSIDNTFDAVVVSTAVENSNPDILKAQSLGLNIIHRSQFLSEIINNYKTIAIAGTSGKSTVTAMVFEILEKAGFEPSLINGANLDSLKEKGYIGNSYAGKGQYLVVEADESDGSLVNYNPNLGVVMNIQKDHKDIKDLKVIFEKFLKNCIYSLCEKEINLDCSRCKKYSVKDINDVVLHQLASSFNYKSNHYHLLLPGHYNIENAVAAINICEYIGVSLNHTKKGLAEFRGIERRFKLIGTTFNNIKVIDDFAHNPAKVDSALNACRNLGKRIVAIFHLHGFGPARFLKQDFINVFKKHLLGNNILIMPEIYYAGGSAKRDISAKDYIDQLNNIGIMSYYFYSKNDILNNIKNLIKNDDIVISMGARDSSLSDFARMIFKKINE